jgi:hypothetical protein
VWSVDVGPPASAATRAGQLVEEEDAMTATELRPVEWDDLDDARPDEEVGSPYALVRIIVAIACLLGAQFLHWSVIDQHAREWSASGNFFFLLALAEGAMTVLILARLRPWVAAAAIAVSVLPVCIWLWDRTLGLPFGPTKGVRGTIGRSDVLSVVFEIITVVALLPYLDRAYADRKPGAVDRVGRVVIGITCVYVLAFSSWAMLGDQGRIHHLLPPNQVPLSKTSPTPLNTGP